MPIQVQDEEDLAAVQALHQSVHEAEAEEDMASTMHAAAVPPLLLMVEDDVAPEGQEEAVPPAPQEEEAPSHVAEEVSIETPSTAKGVTPQEDVTAEEKSTTKAEVVEQAAPVLADNTNARDKEKKEDAPAATTAPPAPSQKKNDKNKKKKKKGKW